MDDYDDLLNASSHKVQKTKVDVRSENAKKFREMFDKGEVPEGKEGEKVIPATAEKDAELEMMRKSKREQREYFQMMEAGKLEGHESKRKEPKLLVGKLKDVSFGNFEIMIDLNFEVIRRSHLVTLILELSFSDIFVRL